MKIFDFFLSRFFFRKLKRDLLISNAEKNQRSYRERLKNSDFYDMRKIEELLKESYNCLKENFPYQLSASFEEKFQKRITMASELDKEQGLSLKKRLILSNPFSNYTGSMQNPFLYRPIFTGLTLILMVFIFTDKINQDLINSRISKDDKINHNLVKGTNNFDKKNQSEQMNIIEKDSSALSFANEKHDDRLVKRDKIKHELIKDYLEKRLENKPADHKLLDRIENSNFHMVSKQELVSNPADDNLAGKKINNKQSKELRNFIKRNEAFDQLIISEFLEEGFDRKKDLIMFEKIWKAKHIKLRENHSNSDNRLIKKEPVQGKKEFFLEDNNSPYRKFNSNNGIKIFDANYSR